MNQEECVKALIAFFQDNDNKEYTEMIDLLKWSLSCKEKAKQFIKREKEYHYGNIYMTRYGVCKDFAKEFKDFCDKLNLPCETIQGDILSDGVKCGHAWNVVMINGKLKHIDISSAIHCVDGTNSDNTPDDFFLKTFEELTAADNGKGREILESSRKTIKSFISKSTGFNIED